jgi:hypothetical protein
MNRTGFLRRLMHGLSPFLKDGLPHLQPPQQQYLQQCLQQLRQEHQQYLQQQRAEAEAIKKPDPVTEVLKERKKLMQQQYQQQQPQQQLRFLNILENSRKDWRGLEDCCWPPLKKKYDSREPWNG